MTFEEIDDELEYEDEYLNEYEWYDEEEDEYLCFGCGSPVDVCRCFGG